MEMSVTFRPAVRSNVNLLIGLAGGTGAGKSYTAMRLASGMTGDKRFAVIDTESGRASHYADQFKFDVCELRPPFTPSAYREAIEAAVAAGYTTIVVDSMSHEYAGDGGVLDMQEAEFQRMGGHDGVKVASWIKPKGEHKRMMQYLLQVRAHLILCFRAEPKIEIVKEADEKGRMRTKIIPKQSLTGLDGWIPITEKNVPFELTVSLMFTADAPGIPKPIKLQEQHKNLFPLNKEVTEESGRLIVQWASGAAPQAASPDCISEGQAMDLNIMLHDHGIPTSKLLAKVGADKVDNIKLIDYDRAVKWVQAVVEARAGAAL
jgi:AAA domain